MATSTSWKDLVGVKIANVRRHQGMIIFYNEKDWPIMMVKDGIFDGRGNYIETDSIPDVKEK